MRKFVVAGLATFLVVAGSPASADTAEAQGEVTVFSTEFQELSVYENPSGCQVLPLGAHVLVNRTDQPVRIHADPFCATPSLVVPPAYGSHVPPDSGSFSVDA
ncbi:hypothetical protein [Actinophytocola gossypii]|uniref:Secreted protein n=1 Tax=Actinophytocola gossypii TaxID=2812003 RepID=A0ABT2JCE5_9PSEU|nr:hypothetical protein [Actinophytocola gossypii]MCT2585538.1 hypothetical protein [Actinophytocola gossypii]